jgi:hypothetical protein
MAGVKKGASCRELLKKFNIIPLANEFLFSLLLFVVDNVEKLQTNSDIHCINTRHKHDLLMLNANQTRCYIDAYYAGIKSFKFF